MYEMRNDAGLTNLAEGMLKMWSWGGRVVLAGDPAHKVTPNVGWGFNAGTLDVVVLVNALRRAASETSGRGGPTAVELQRVFDAYTVERIVFMKKITTMSSNVTKMSGWLDLAQDLRQDAMAGAMYGHIYGEPLRWANGGQCAGAGFLEEY